MKRSVLLMILTLLLLTSCTAEELPTTDDPIISMTFMAGYKPQANLPFVGVYIAQEKGFFAEESLDVTIEHSPGKGEHLQLLTAGKVHVTTQDASVLLKRRADPGLPLVSFALIGQKGQQAFAALTSSDITSLEDWIGKIVGYKGTPPPDLFAMLANSGITEDQLELVNVGFDPRVLTEEQVDIYPVYKSNEPYMIQSWGYDLTLWDPGDHGVPSLGLTYVTSDDILAENPEMLTRFLRASLRGIEYASNNIEETVEIVMQYTGPETDPDHMRFMLEAELIDAFSPVTDEFGLGWQTIEQWQLLADLLVEFELITPIDVETAYTNQLLEEIFEE